MRTPVTPDWECSTPTTLHGRSMGCQHRFTEPGQAHYCTSIRAPEIVATLYPATTPDEHLIVSYLSASVLWWYLQARELAALERMLSAGQPLTLEQKLLAEKRLDRCILLAQTAQEAGGVLSRYIVAVAPHISVGFGIEGNIAAIRLYDELHSVTNRVHAALLKTRTDTLTLRSRMQEYAQLAGENRRAVLRLLAVLNDPAKPSVALETLLSEELLAWSAETLEQHHPQAVHDPDDTDPSIFIIAHQVFEVWFPATISALDTATRSLLMHPPAVLAAFPLVHRAADLVRLWHRMIHLPETMSAPDYISFRAQLEDGSGAESEAFREIEIRAGLRNVDYWQRLELMQLLTPRLAALWEQPSLNEAIIQVLVARGIVAPDAPLPQQAELLADILLPTGAAHPHADAAALCRAALMLDEQLWLWRQHHLAMVRSVIGGKPSIGVGGVQNHERLSSDPQAEPVGGTPYLETTTRSRLFPLISLALEHLQEHWQPSTHPVVTRRSR